MLNRFIDEIVSKGASAVLPHLLEDRWLTPITAAARRYLITAMADDGKDTPTDPFEDEGADMMLAAVMEAVQWEKGYPAELSMHEVPEEEMHEYLTCYALWTVITYLSRHGELQAEPPTLEKLFDRERIFQVEQANAPLSSALHHFMAEGAEGEA